MAKNVKNQNVEAAQNIGEAVSKTEQFFKKYSKVIIYSGVGLVVVAAIILATIQFYIKPLQKEAIDQSYVAEQYFRGGNYFDALNGDGSAMGIAQIIDEYGKKAGQAMYFYAGVCELHIGNYDNAIWYLKKYNGKDEIMKARALACIGDAYAYKSDFTTAASYYDKAANEADNAYAAGYLLKAGIMYEELQNASKALKVYESIKEKYPQTLEGYEIDKYIQRLKEQQAL